MNRQGNFFIKKERQSRSLKNGSEAGPVYVDPELDPVFFVERPEPALFYRSPHFCHEVVVEIQIMQYAQAHSEAFVGL